MLVVKSKLQVRIGKGFVRSAPGGSLKKEAVLESGDHVFFSFDSFSLTCKSSKSRLEGETAAATAAAAARRRSYGLTKNRTSESE